MALSEDISEAADVEAREEEHAEDVAGVNGRVDHVVEARENEHADGAWEYEDAPDRDKWPCGFEGFRN